MNGAAPPHVVVIGGGFAGLVAGVSLAERGVRVTVLESRPKLGGRACSFRDERTGEVVDNGQHAMMGCYTHTLAFLRRIGAEGKVVRQANLCVEMWHPSLGRGRIAFAPLPSPLHALAGILRYRLLSPVERRRALLGGVRLMVMHRRGDARLRALTVERLLVRLGQSPHARECFWNPIAVATLNETPERAAAAPLAEVLARAFFSSREGSRFVLARVGLSDLYAGDAAALIERRGGAVRARAAVSELVIEEGRATGVRLRDGRLVAADAVISTVPPRALLPLLPPALRETPALRRLAEIETSPIVSTHLWFDRPVLDAEFVGLVGRTTQFAFDRSRLTGTTSGGGGQLVSTVVSAGRDVAGWDVDRIRRVAAADVRAAGGRPDARLLRAVVVKEKHATISVTVEAERLRPGPRTDVRGFYLAGDWTRTGLPATIESAVLSGERAADLAAGMVGEPRGERCPRAGDRKAEPLAGG